MKFAVLCCLLCTHENSTPSTNPFTTESSLLLGRCRRIDQLVGPGDEEAADLHLLDVVEAQHAHEAAGVGVLAFLNLTQHLGGVGAPEHGQLPHGPVPPVVVAGVLLVVGEGDSLRVDVELEAGDELLLDHVVHLLGDLVIRQGGQAREGLELGLADGFPHLHTTSGTQFTP